MRRRLCCQRGPCHFRRSNASGEAAGELPCGKRVQVGRPREVDVECLEPFGGGEQQRRSVATVARRERDLRPEQVNPGASELIKRSRPSDDQQLQGRIGRAGQVLGLRRGQRAPRPARRIDRQRTARSRNAAAAANPPRA